MSGRGNRKAGLDESAKCRSALSGSRDYARGAQFNRRTRDFSQLPANLLDSSCHKLSVIVGSSLFLFGVFLLAARDAYVPAGGGHIGQVIGPDFLAAYTADRLENHLLRPSFVGQA